MAESQFDELKRYVRFGPDDEVALRGFAATAAPHFRRISEEFYRRLEEHETARQVFSGPAQVQRLKDTLCDWMALLFAGPWDEAYYDRRARIGRVHVRIALPQRYMFGAMDVMRIGFLELIQDALGSEPARRLRVAAAIHKILDLELAIMLETYREAFVEEVQHHERLEKAALSRQLAVSEARYEEVVEKAEALISTIDADGRILLFNSGCERATGLPRREAAGRPWLELFVRPEDLTLVRARQRAVLAGEPGTPYEGPVVTGREGSRRIRWHFTTLPGGTGPVLCALGLDVSDEYDLAVRTRRAERLASLGTMAAGLAHEIRNPLNAAHLQLQVARRRIERPGGPDLDAAVAAVDLATSEMKRLATLVEDFLQFARPQPLRTSFLDLRATAEVTVALVGPEAAAAGVELTLEPGAPVRTVFDDEKMKQVLINLVRNAVEATGAGGRVRLVVEHHDTVVRLQVEDDGRGLPPDEPIFEPFFTTKEQGTGLGLSVVHRIVGDHAGTVEVDSRPGRTVFSVLLPAAEGPGSAAVRHG